MKRTAKNFLILSGIISAFISGLIVSKFSDFEQTAGAQSSQQQQQRQWETMVIRGNNLPEGIEGAANLRGTEGWEPVTVLQTKDGNFVAFMKRRK